MRIFSVVECIIYLIFIAYLVYEYSSKKAPSYVKIITYISWVISFGFVFVLPLDIYYTQHNISLKRYNLDPKLQDTYEIKYIELTWTVIYWINFLLIWFILPILQDFEDAGEFTIKDKLKRSLYNNTLLYGIFVLLGGLFMIYLSYYGKMTMSAMMEFFAGLSNCFGTFLVILLMGHGLVAIPKKYINERTQELNLKYYQGKAKKSEQTKVNAKYQMERLIKIVYLMKEQYSDKHVGQYCTKILEEVNPQIMNDVIKDLRYTNLEDLSRDLTDINMNKIVQLNRQVKKSITDYLRAETKWQILLDNAFLVEDILENQFSIHYKIRSTFWVERSGYVGDILDKIQWFWYVKIKSNLKLILGVIFSIFSLIIIYGELSMFLDLDISIFKIFSQSDEYFKTQILILIPLLYISFCSYYGLFHIQFSGFYCFFKHHNTDAPSLLFGSINFSRVSAPLCYNFLQMMRIQNTSCEQVIGKFDTSVFGSFSAFFFPVVLIIFTLFNFFDIYDFVVEKFNLQQLEFSHQPIQSDIDEGKKILYKARLHRERKFLTKQSTDLRNFNGYSINQFSTRISMYNDDENRNIISYEKAQSKQRSISTSSLLTNSSNSNFYKNILKI
ncbi:hypothetical protein ABPG72_012014 [Tetrahymena utriculariae]